MNKDTIGIDISKDTLDAHRLSTGAAAQFANSAAGLRALRRWIGAQMPDLVVYEATGAYHAALERGFAGVLPLVKVNPLQARRFAQARGTRAKTDEYRDRTPFCGLIHGLEKTAQFSRKHRVGICEVDQKRVTGQIDPAAEILFGNDRSKVVAFQHETEKRDAAGSLVGHALPSPSSVFCLSVPLTRRQCKLFLCRCKHASTICTQNCLAVSRNLS